MAIPSPTLQFGRTAKVVVQQAGAPLLTIETSDAAGHRISGSIKKTLRPEPNAGTAQITGLSAEQRGFLTGLMNLTKAGDIENRGVEIFAGYGVPESLYRGQIADISHVRNGPTWTTTIRATFDGYQGADLNSSFLGQVNYSDVLQLAGAAMGMDTSTVEQNVARALPNSRKVSTLNGAVFVGPAKDAANEAADALGMEWSEDDGKMILVPRGTFTTDFAVVLNPSTGLLEDPVAEEFDRYSVRFLLNPKVRPGRQVQLQDAEFKPVGAGVFRADVVDAQFDTHGGDFTMSARLRPTR